MSQRDDDMTLPTVNIEVDASKAIEYIEGLDEAVKTLENACRMYCSWYDNGQPPIDGSAMSYELVMSIRVALAKIKGEDQHA